MLRRAFTMRLKSNALSEYKRHHENVWPELIAEIKRSGIARMSIFQQGRNLFLISEIDSTSAWNKLWNSSIHRRWAKLMQPLLHLRPDGMVDAKELTEIFNLEARGPTKKNISRKQPQMKVRKEAKRARQPVIRRTRLGRYDKI